METAEGDVQFRPRTGKAASTPLLPEVEAYLQLLLVVHLTNNKRYTEVSPLSAVSRWSPVRVQPCFSVCVCCRLRRCQMTCCRRSAQRTAELWIWWLPSVTTTTPECTSSSTSLTPYAGTRAPGTHTHAHAHSEMRARAPYSGVNEPSRSCQVFRCLSCSDC